MLRVLILMAGLIGCRSLLASSHRNTAMRLRPLPGSTANPTPASNSFGERIESVKSGVVATVSGSLAFAPYAIVQGLIEPVSFSAQWEFDQDMCAS